MAEIDPPSWACPSRIRLRFWRPGKHRPKQCSSPFRLHLRQGDHRLLSRRWADGVPRTVWPARTIRSQVGIDEVAPSVKRRSHSPSLGPLVILRCTNHGLCKLGAFEPGEQIVHGHGIVLVVYLPWVVSPDPEDPHIQFSEFVTASFSCFWNASATSFRRFSPRGSSFQEIPVEDCASETDASVCSGMRPKIAVLDPLFLGLSFPLLFPHLARALHAVLHSHEMTEARLRSVSSASPAHCPPAQRRRSPWW